MTSQKVVELLIAISLAMFQPSVMFIHEKKFMKIIRKYRESKLMLLTAWLYNINLNKMKNMLESTLNFIGKNLSYKNIIVYTGASRCCKGFKEYFVEETLKQLDKPMKLNGIVG